MFQLDRNTNHVDRAWGRARVRLGGGVEWGTTAGVEYEFSTDTGRCASDAAWSG